MAWHLVRCASGVAMPIVAESLRGIVASTECFYRVERVPLRGTMVTRKFPLFDTPYVFANWETHDPVTWHEVRRVRGVREIIGGVVPAVVSDVEVSSWRALVDDNGVLDVSEARLALFEIGHQVTFTLGSFEDTLGEVVGFRGQSVGIKFCFLGRDNVVYLPPNIVCLAGRVPDPDHEVSRARRCRRSKRGRRSSGRRHTIGAGLAPMKCGTSSDNIDTSSQISAEAR